MTKNLQDRLNRFAANVKQASESDARIESSKKEHMALMSILDCRLVCFSNNVSGFLVPIDYDGMFLKKHGLNRIGFYCATIKIFGHVQKNLHCCINDQ